MKVYTNLPLNFSIEDQDKVDEKCETYILQEGIYQKYKKHFSCVSVTMVVYLKPKDV